MRKCGKEQTLCNGNGQIWARIEKRKMQHLGRMGNIKKVQHHEYHVSEESRKEIKRCNIPLCITVQTQTVPTSIHEQVIVENVYIELLKEIYTNSSMAVHLHKKAATRLTTGEECNREIPYRPNYLWPQSKAYFDD